MNNKIDTSDWRKMPRMMQVLIYTLHNLEKMVECGLLSDGPLKNSAKATIMAEEMEKAAKGGLWLLPIQDEIYQAMDALLNYRFVDDETRH